MQAKGPCYWFGRPGQCRNWVVMATVAGTFAGFDLCFSVFLAVSGSGVGRTISALMQRCAPRPHLRPSPVVRDRTLMRRTGGWGTMGGGEGTGGGHRGGGAQFVENWL